MSNPTFGRTSTPTTVSSAFTFKKSLDASTLETPSSFATLGKNVKKRSFDMITTEIKSDALYMKQLSILASGFMDKSYSDFEIRCGKENYPVHKFVVFKQSDYFKKLAQDTSAEQDFLQLEEDPYIVKLSLEWLYTAKYTCDPHTSFSAYVTNPTDAENTSNDDFSYNSLVTHAKVYSLAKKWILPDLQLEACNRYSSAIITEGWSGAFTSSLRVICSDPKENYGKDKMASVALGYAALKFNDFLSQESFCQFLSERGDVAVLVGKMRAKLAVNPPTILHAGMLSILKCSKCNDDSDVRISSRNEKSAFGTPGIYFCTKCQHDF